MSKSSYPHLLYCLLIALGLSMVVFPVVSDIEEPSYEYHGTLLAFYLVGNDIESQNRLGDYGFITQNLLDMREGYGSGNPNLTVIIAYGGADKEGWRGMRVYSLADATSDFQDNGRYDSWDTYTRSYPDYNMGTKESFQEFLSLLEPWRNAERTYLIMSGHGAAYKGAFPDENYDTGNIPLPDLKDALARSGIHFDLIGLDTCLMGTIEVADALSGTTRYLLASEETEPSRGWNYSMIAHELVNNPSIDPKELGIHIIDGYIRYQVPNSPATLSLIDIDAIPAVISSLDDFSRSLQTVYKDPEGKRIIEEILTNSGEFGLQMYMSLKTDERIFISYTLDIISFAKNIGNALPAMHPASDSLIQSVSDAVLYHTEQKRPYAHGLSIFSPVHKEIILEHIFEYSPVIAISEEWYSFLIQFFRSVLSDKERPVLTNSENGILVRDDGYATVQIEFVRHNADGDVLLGAEPAYAYPSGEYVLPEWDGRAFHLKDPKTGKIQIMPVFFQRRVDNQTEEYYAFSRISKEDDPDESWICIDIYFESTTGRTTMFFLYLGPDEENILKVARSGRLNSISDMAGIGLIPYAVVQSKNGERTWKPVASHPFELNEDVVTSYEAVACGSYDYFLVATDMHGNRAEGQRKRLDLPC